MNTKQICLNTGRLLFNCLNRLSVQSQRSYQTDMNTADLCDAYGDALQYLEPCFKDYGKKKKFHGMISTVKCFEDNSKVKEALAEPGQGKVLVVDGGASHRRALLGDNVAALAIKSGWSGILINGCLRDSEEIGSMDIGVKALATIPRKTEKKNIGDRNIEVTFAGVTFKPGFYLYSDPDGVVVSETKLEFPKL